MRSLDGLRGLAALVVVFHHLSLTLAPFSDVWIVPGATHPAVGSVYWWFTSTPAQLFIAGPEAVLVFFVLSGFVVVQPALRNPEFDWIAYFPQRVARLWLPVLGSVILAFVWILLTDQTAAKASSLWVAASSLPGLPWQQAVDGTDLLFGVPLINNVLWSLRWELLFSLMLPLFVVAVLVARRKWWVVLVGSFAGVVLGTYTGNGALTFLPVFLVGSVLAVKLDDIRGWLARHSGSRWLLPGGAAVLLISLVLLDLHWTIWGVLGGAPRFQEPAKSLEFVGAFGLLVVAAFWLPAVRLLSTRVFQWLGKISFSLYLVHVPIIIAIDSMFDRQYTALRIVVSLACSIGVAVLFSRFVELPAHRLSRYLGAGSSGVIRRSLGARATERARDRATSA
jgi:peptidoglycan/LPS O-acetylase OafA/YrhL